MVNKYLSWLTEATDEELEEADEIAKNTWKEKENEDGDTEDTD